MGKEGSLEDVRVPERVFHSRPARRRRRIVSPLSVWEDRSFRRAERSTSFAASALSVLLNSREISSAGFGFGTGVAGLSFGVANSLLRVLVVVNFRNVEVSVLGILFQVPRRIDCRCNRGTIDIVLHCRNCAWPLKGPRYRPA
jgi:hypothetical protein